MKSNLFALFITIAVCLSGCSRSEHSRTEAIRPMQLIKKTGLYELETVQLNLRVFEDKQGRIDYTLTDRAGGVLLQAKRKFSPMHRWAMAFDASQRLWVHSSDVGTVVWERSDTGAYLDKLVTQDNAKEMPKVLFDMLPNVLQKRWESSKP